MGHGGGAKAQARRQEMLHAERAAARLHSDQVTPVFDRLRRTPCAPRPLHMVPVVSRHSRARACPRGGSTVRASAVRSACQLSASVLPIPVLTADPTNSPSLFARRPRNPSSASPGTLGVGACQQCARACSLSRQAHDCCADSGPVPLLACLPAAARTGLLDWQIYRTAQMPGPGTYPAPQLPTTGGAESPQSAPRLQDCPASVGGAILAHPCAHTGPQRGPSEHTHTRVCMAYRWAHFKIQIKGLRR